MGYQKYGFLNACCYSQDYCAFNKGVVIKMSFQYGNWELLSLENKVKKQIPKMLSHSTSGRESKSLGGTILSQF